LADDWQTHCLAQCSALGVELEVLHVAVNPAHADGPEAAAREARYAALRESVHAGDLQVTAHHQDDQAETVLLRLLRGTGVSGLAAMRPLAEFAPGRLWRPLLKVPRDALFKYAQWHRLGWIEDPHNREPRYARSWLRAEILPRLRTRWPQAGAQLAQAAAHCGEAVELLDELAAGDLLKAAHAEALSVAALLDLRPVRRRNLLRYWLRQRGFQAPGADALERLQREVLRADEDAQPLLHCGDYELRRYRDDLHAMTPLPPPPAGVELQWNGLGALRLPPGCGSLVFGAASALPFLLAVRFAQGGERIKPAGSAHTRSLKNLFQEAAVPPWIRVRTPLLYRGHELLAVGDFWCTAAWQALCAQSGFRQCWQPEETGSAD
ncbi:MAG: tRNA lysidine(34) synthetase TilS, partial [Stenotrophobium sp.]